MAKLVISLLLATLLQVQAFDNVQYHTQNPYTVAIGSNLFTVSQNSSHIWIDSTDGNVAPCKIAVDSEKVKFTERIKATAVSQKIIVWGEQSFEKINEGHTTRTSYTVLLLDPKQCSYKVLFEELVNEVPSEHVRIPAEVVTHENSFDVFLPGQSECSPCRYDVDGKKLATPKQIVHVGAPRSPFHIREIGKTNKYYYIFNFDNGNAKVFKLDQDYQDLAPPTTFASTIINDFAISSDGNDAYFALTKIYPNSNSYLIINDGHLSTKQLTRFPRVANHRLYETLTSSDSQGNWNVVLLNRSNLDQSTNVRLVRYTAGLAIKDQHEIGKLDSDKKYDVQNVVLDGGKDCVVVHELSNGVTNVKCFEY